MQLLRALFIATALSAMAMTSFVATPVSFAQDWDADRKKRALGHYKQGNAHYNLENYKEAVQFFRKAYIEFSDPAFLFNIAQAYRQLGNCKDGIAFYKKYLSEGKRKVRNRREVKAFIRGLEETCAKQQRDSELTPTGPMSPDEANLAAGTSTLTDPVEVAVVSEPTTTPAPTVSGESAEKPALMETTDGPKLVVARLDAGGAFFLGFGSLKTPVQFLFSVGAGYPIKVTGLTVDIGANLSRVGIAWNDGETTGNSSSLLALANVGVTKHYGKIRVGGQLGLGVNVFRGLGDDGNPFADPMVKVSGALSSFGMRVALEGGYEITKNLFVLVQPLTITVVGSTTAMNIEIDNLNTYQFSFGLGYQH